MNLRYLKNILLIILFLFAQLGYSQLSKMHYIPPLTSGLGNANPEEQYIYLSTPSDSDIVYTIKPIGQPSSNYITGTISNTDPGVISIGSGTGQLFMPSDQTSEIVKNKGYIIEGEDLIYVSIRMRAGSGAQAGALVSKGLSALGSTFRVGSFTNEGSFGQNNYLNFVSVMATEDNTQVSFSDLKSGMVIENYGTVTTSINVILDEGESYTIATNSEDDLVNEDGLIGTLVTSDNPIVVNCGSANGSFGDESGNGRDYGIDQIVGLSKVGTKYIFVKGGGNDDWENVLIVPNTYPTDIFVNGNSTPITITASDRYELLEGFNFNANGNMYVETSQPVFAYQGVGSTGEANQGMFFVPPLSCEARGNIDNIANIDYIGGTQYSGGISIVTKIGATVTINNQPLPSNTIGPSLVSGNTDYVTYKIDGLTNNISVQGDDELYVAYYNVNGAATSGSFYSGFPSNPEINFDAEFVTLGNCIPNIDLSVANAENFDSFSWYFDDGTGVGFVDLLNSNTTITPINPGKYKLIGTVACSGLTLESVEVPVSICPDDIDNDGIIDNIDIDNDNDGILNCSESRGNVTVNLTNLSSPQLIFQDGTTNSVITDGNYTKTSSSNTSNSFSGTNSGNFTSSISATTNAKNDYTLTFSESVNVKLSEDLSVTHSSVDGEYFIAKISPVNRNITLVDPDDRLLIDSNFDGVFETGITYISGSEIHFKVNSSPAGSTRYQFLANQVDGFTFKHFLTNINNNSNFKAIISLTCFKLDTDNDGIVDALDLDSDNDGIPDIVEANGKLLILSGVDSDKNGLDDVFDINGDPIDTDTDGVLDFLDLDSDNDGIFDLEESGSFLPDKNFDGIIDNILTTIGLNGWDDNAETSPDNGEIAYTVLDTDANNLYNYINNDSDGDLCSDVIEAGFTPNPTNNNIIDGTGIKPTNGLIIGSDGYTTPISDYINVGTITINTQPVDTDICELDSTIITIETNVIDSYQWQVSTDGTNWNDIVDDLVYSNSTTNELTLSAVPLNYNDNKYRIVLEKIKNTCGLISDEITLTVNEFPIANVVNDLIECDNLDDTDDTNGIIQSFDLESQTTTILGTSQLPVDYNVTYHLSQIDADTGTNILLSPYENLVPNSQTIFVRVENINTGCFISNSTFYLIVNPIPIANTISDLVECDNLNDGDDINGIVQNFDLESQTTKILGIQPISDFTVTYHLSSEEAISGNSPLSSPHENILSPNSQTIFVRIVNNSTGCVNPHLTFNVIVNKLPIANTVLNLEECDNLDDSNDTNGIIQSFDLENQTNTILGIQPTSDFTVSYHLSDTDAILGNAPLSSPHSNNSSPNSQTIFVRVLNNSTGCINTHLNFDVIVHPLPIVTSTVTLKQCDDDIDGFSPFNLYEANEKISTNASNESFTYYLTEQEAISKTNPIPNPTTFINRTVYNEIVWANVQSEFGCSEISQVDLIVTIASILPSNQWYFYECDDLLDEQGNDNQNNNKRDGISTFDFSNVDQEVRDKLPPKQEVLINYYRNEADALAENNPIQDISNYRNIGYPHSQNIYIRIDSQISNDCLGLGHHITLNVEALPFANAVTIDSQCDDDLDGKYPFDTSLVHNTVLNGQTNVTVTYFDENNHPLPSPLPNPFITKSQTVKIVVTNNETLVSYGPCFDETFLNFVVDVVPIANQVYINPVCDDESNDGFYEFDTSSIESTILGNQTGMEVFYYNQNGAELPSPLPNPFRTTSQTISVEVINSINADCISFTSFDFVVDAAPIANPVYINPVCDDQSNDGFYDFDTSSIESTILENQTGMEVFYFDQNGAELPSPLPNPFRTTSQTISVEVINSINVDCISLTSFDFVVNAAPIANPVYINPVCDDESNDGFYEFDTSSIESTILGNQTGMEIFYYDQNGAELSSPLPNPFRTTSQTISVKVINPINVDCISFTSFDFVVNPLPNFTVDSPRIICLTNPQESIFLETYPDDTKEIFKYKWYNENGDLIADTQIAEIFEPGMYIVELTRDDGTKCSRTKDIVVNPSEIANITYNDVIIKDDSDNNTITIITENNNLGIGDYEFSIIDDFYGYQDEAFFNNVEAGIHTVYTRDKNNCGIASLRVSVLGYPKFFTPNYDGFNDTWNVLGLDKEFYPIAKIYIFDRFGKLLKTLNQDGQGWDGIYNGNALPSTDYWFTAELIDTEGTIRYKKGHFSLIRR